MPGTINVSRRQFMATAAGAAATAALAGHDLAQTRPIDRPLGWAVMGIGTLTINQILPALTKTSSARLAGLISGHPEKAKACAAKYGLDPKHIYDYDNMHRMQDDADIDVVYVVLPNGLHKEFTLRAAQAGKHVFCEKPMANTAADCSAMITACADRRSLLGIGYRMQHEPHLLEMRRLVRAGAIGKITAVKSAFGFSIGPNVWRLDKTLAGGGPLMDVGIYCLNSIRFALGEEPVAVTAAIPDATGDPRFKEVEPAMDFTLKFPGITADCKTAYNGFPGNRLRIEGELGAIHLEPAFSYGGLMMGVQKGEARPETFTPKPADQFATEIEAFSRAILDEKPAPTPGEQGLRDMRIIEALYQAAKTNGEIQITN